MRGQWRRARARIGSLLAALPVVILLLGGCDKREDKPTAAGSDDKSKVPAEGEDTTYGLTEEQAEKVLVRVGDREITLGDFAERLASQSPYLRARYNSPERRREFLENMIRFELLAIEAERRGHDELPEVQRVRKQIMVQRMMDKLFDEEGVKLADVTDAEVKAYYEQHQSEFNKPPQVRASHILFKDKAAAKKVLSKLKQSPGDMQLFRELAKEHNQDPATRARLGDLTFFYEDPALPEQPDIPLPVRKAAFSLANTGDVYQEVIKSDQGFHIVKLVGKRAKLERSLEDAKRLIKNRLWREKREKAIREFIAGLREKADVKEDLTMLSQIEIHPQVPKLPGGEGARDNAAK